MIQTTDQLGRTIILAGHPFRIVSTVPSQTELLFDLGSDEDVIGITKFCIHPQKWFRSKERVGGTKDLNLEKIRMLNPDLVITNKEENTEEQIAQLMKEFPVWVSDIKNLEDAIEMIGEVSRIVGKADQGKTIVERIRTGFDGLRSFPEINCVYLIWKRPLMTIGGDTFISEMMKYAGFRNIFENKKRYPEITNEDIKTDKPQFILLSSEPFPFKEKELKEFKTSFPETTVILVDGEMFSWYGSRLMKAPAYFLKLREKIEAAL